MNDNMTTSCVPFKITIEGQEFEAYITEKHFEAISELLNKKKTGYERATKEDGTYYFDNGGGYVGTSFDSYPETEGPNAYRAANYYTTKQVAENNVRADKLMRQLRRLSVEHRKNDDPAERFYIYYLKTAGILQLRRDMDNRYIGPWFDSLQAGANAIEEFKDELIWYFTEYRDSL